VDVLLQDIRELEGLGQRLKRMDYEYDLLSGNVHQVSYQAGQWDEFHHRYRYDADNRLLDVRTSADGRIWERDARYFYYAHGPLARTELGDKQVQGTDHFYTIQGWLKGVNSVRLTAAADAGQDAKTTGLNKPFALDAMGYVLRYHGNDYSPVGGSVANTMLPSMSTGTYATAFAPNQLYNGNIPSMLTALQDLSGTNLNLHANVYRYDLLNRIKAQTVFKGANSGSDLSGLTTNNEYGTAYDFDANGNFDRHERRGNLGGTQMMDDLQYWYLTETNALYTPSQTTLPSDRTNKLAYVYEAAPVTTTGEDLEDQENISPYPNDNNYAYDEQGRLTQDILAGIGPDGISWNLQDKVRRVTRDPNLPNNASTPDLEFRYGATGNRTVKVLKPRSGGVQQTASTWERTYYIHDAQGNPMSIYRRTYLPNGGTSYTDKLQQLDAMVYGSARLGDLKTGREKLRNLTSNTPAMTGVSYASVLSDFWTNGQGGYPTTALSVTRELGLRHYELSNHLGNVLSTVSDRRLAVASGSVLAYYRAEEKSYADYDPYGMLLPGRFGGGFADQKFGFQGQLKDDELNGSAGTSYAFEYRVHDSRVGRFFSIDPLAAKYAYNSTYAFSENRVVDMGELEGLETTPKGKYLTNTDLDIGINNTPIDNTGTGKTTADPALTIKSGGQPTSDCGLITPLVEMTIDGATLASSTAACGIVGFGAFAYGGISTFSERGAYSFYESVKNGDDFNLKSLRFSFSEGFYEYRCLDGMSGEITLDEGIGIVGGLWYIGKVLPPVTTTEGFLFGSVGFRTPMNIRVGLFASENTLTYKNFKFSTIAPKWISNGTESNSRRWLQITKEFQDPLGPWINQTIPKGTFVRIGLIGPQKGLPFGTWLQLYTPSSVKLKIPKITPRL
jgi:RHS repeat-associated protein